MSKNQLIEVSWEVCNNVGGIGTVICSKADITMQKYKNNYLTLGPLLSQNSDFIEDQGVADEYKEVLERLAGRDIKCKAGFWNVKAKPKCLLIDFKGLIQRQDKILYNLWHDFGVDSMFGQWDYIEPVLFSTACGMVIEELTQHYDADDKIICHFHEWLSGAGLLYAKIHIPEVSTIFTTHATVLGRTLSAVDDDLYLHLEEIDAVQEAKKHNVSAKYSIENVCAREADCFCSVSDITAKECDALLGHTPDVITYNGFDTKDIPSINQIMEEFPNKRKNLLEFASKFLQKELPAEQTKIISIAGRYEFHNKGIDLLLESLYHLNQAMKDNSPEGTNVVTFFFVMGGAVGVHEEALLRVRETFSGYESSTGISTHYLSDVHNDPIINTCKRLNLFNNPGDPCNIIFVPAYLDGNDGILNIPYFDALAGCDVGVFPSNYEPWGYTPHESIAYGVPAITTDKAGFGHWINQKEKGKSGVVVLNRMENSYNNAITQLTESLQHFIALTDDQMRTEKNRAYKTAQKYTWKIQFPNYEKAYELALSKNNERLMGLTKLQELHQTQTNYMGTNSTIPHLRSFSIVSAMPEKLDKLEEIAYNLWWAYNPKVRDLYMRLDPVLWEKVGNNPVAFLQQVNTVKLKEAVKNKAFMNLYKEMISLYEGYISESKAYTKFRHISAKKPVAYFSMEFGIHEAFPIYSGGLGILSGDHLKAASDMNIPLIGFGLLYKYGYFSQKIAKDGSQQEVFEESHFGQLPIEPVVDKLGKRILIAVELPGRQLFAQAWKAEVGRTTLYLLDTDIDENSRGDSKVTAQLYCSDTRLRVEQEILLGIGGARLIEALGINPSVYHLNEGHSAFLMIELIRDLMKNKQLDFETASEAVKAKTVFTTHTPVPAGNESFEKSLIENYFKSYIEQAGIKWEQFWNLGHFYAGESSNYEMTILALKLSQIRNGVSKLHGEVSRGMWKDLWRGFLPEEVPIGSITNGVHFSSWIAEDMRNVIESYARINCQSSLLKPEEWQKISEIPDRIVWQTHTSLKNKLFDYIMRSVQTSWTREGEDPALIDQFRSHLNPAALTICFARRFATYKRPTLLFTDIERIRKMVLNTTHPVQFIFAGKAHPADKGGAALIQEVVNLSKQKDFLGKIIFLENYNIKVARLLVAGVDVWLNNPIRPLEASGTSGMKAAINGVPNASILDGWWDESFISGEKHGWAIGDRTMLENRHNQDLIDSDRLYSCLEEEVIPIYYSRNLDNLPEKWIQIMKQSMIDVIPNFNCHRMLSEYVSNLYEPAADKGKRFYKDNFQVAHNISSWKKRLSTRFSTLHIHDIHMEGLQGNVLHFEDELKVAVAIHLGRVETNEVQVELVIKTMDDEHVSYPMKMTEQEGNQVTYSANFKSNKTGRFQYGIRVLPRHPELCNKYETGLVYWA